MKAERLPSGKYRCRVTWMENGKRHMESFTRASASEALIAANKFKNNIGRIGRTDLTIGEAVDKYISIKSNVLSPSTIRGYRITQKRIKIMNQKKIKSLSNTDIQSFVNDLSKMYAPKTVKNTYSLLTAALSHFQPDILLDATLPQPSAPRDNIPSQEEVSSLLSNASRTVQIAIVLCGFCSIRRGAICALKYKDIDRQKGAIHVHEGMVEDEFGEWVIKDSAKTQASNRYVHCPDFVFDIIGDGEPEEYIISVRPNAISNAFRRLRDKLGIDITFHDLRAFYASSMALVGVPDFYVASEGGWTKNSAALKRIYQRVQSDEKKKFLAKSDELFETIVPQNVPRKNKNPVNTGVKVVARGGLEPTHKTQ